MKRAPQTSPSASSSNYTGVLKDLGAALASYDALQGFSEEDIARSIVAIRDEANKVPGAHAALLDIFKSVSNTFDAEAYALLLADEEVRAEFITVFQSFLVHLLSLLHPQSLSRTRSQNCSSAGKTTLDASLRCVHR